MIIIDLESMSKEDFVDFLFCTDFDFEKMKQELEEWMEEGSEV